MIPAIRSIALPARFLALALLAWSNSTVFAQSGCGTSTAGVLAEYDNVRATWNVNTEDAVGLADPDIYRSQFPFPPFSNFTNPLGSVQSDSIVCITSGNNEGPDININLTIPVEALSTCSDVSFTVCRVGDFNGVNEVVWILNKETNVVIGCIPGTGGGECQGYAAINCITVNVPGPLLSPEMADGLLELALVTPGGTSGNQATEVDANCAGSGQTGNCFRLSKVRYDIVIPPSLDQPIDVPDLCVGDTGTATAVVSGTQPISYNWTVSSGGVTLLNSDQASVTIVPLIPGPYQLELELTNGNGVCVENLTTILPGDVFPTTTCIAPPDPNPDLVTISEGSPTIIIDVQANDSDPQGDPLTTTIVFGPSSGGTASVVNGDSIMYTPPTDFFGIDVIIYEVCDPGPLCATDTVFITVNPVNDPPLAVPDTFMVDEDDVLVGDVGGNDSDIDTPASLWNFALLDGGSADANGAFSLNGDGTFTFIPDPNVNGQFSFIYQLCDGGSPTLCDTATATIDVVPVNDPPVAVVDSAYTDEEVPVTIDVLVNDFDIDGEVDSTSVTIATPSSNGNLTVNPDGSINFEPNMDFQGLAAFSYSVCDDGLPVLCDTNWVYVFVNDISDPPVAANDFFNMNEDDLLTGANIGANDYDIDNFNSQLTWSILDSASAGANGSIVLDTNGVISYAPNANFNGTVTFEYQLCDPSGNCDTATALINVFPTNDAPVAIDDYDNTAPQQIVITNVAANDSDPLDQAGGLDLSSLVIITDAANGTATANSNGTITYLPDSAFSGIDSVQYAICDLGNPNPVLCDTAWLFITVDNLFPIAIDDNSTTLEDTPIDINVLSNDSTPVGSLDTTTLVITDPPSNGFVTVNADGSITYTPDPNWYGVDDFTYAICNDTGFCSPATVTVVVDPVNDQPVAINDTIDVLEDAVTAIIVTTNDDDPFDILGNINDSSVVIVTDPVHGNASVDPDGTIIYTPDPNYVGIDSLQYAVCDDGYPLPPLCDTAWVIINVLPTNDPPVIVDDQGDPADTLFYATAINNALVICPLAIDIDGDTVDVTSVFDGPTNGQVTDVNTGDTCFTYTPDPGFAGGDTLSVVVCDPFGGCDIAVIVIDVIPNDPPVIVDNGLPVDTLYLSTIEDEAAQLCLSVVDAEGDDVDVTGTANGPLNGAIIGVNDADTCFTYVPDQDFNGMDTVSIIVCDVFGGCDTVMVIVEVTPVNDPPVALNDSASTNEDTSVTVDVINNDDDDADPNGGLDSTSVLVLVDPPNGSANVDPDGTITYTPNDDYFGTDSLVYVICDLGAPLPAECDTAVLYIQVLPTNDTPVIVDDNGTPTDTVYAATLLDTPLIECLNAVDVDGDSLDITTVFGGPSNGVVTNVNNGDTCFTYTPNTGFLGSDTMTMVICDPFLACDTVVVIISVTTNLPPIAVDDSASVASGNSVLIDNLANDSDPDGDPFTTTSATANNGTVTINGDGSITYTPNAGYCDNDTIFYTICDNGGLCDDAIIIVDVQCPPIAVDDTSSTIEGQSVVIDNELNDSDPDGDPFTTTTASANNGSVTINGDGTLTYVPDPGFCGTDTITYTICDNTGLCDAAIILVEVECVNEPPVAVDDVASTTAGSDVIIDVLNNDFDPDGDPINVTMATANNGTVVINSNGSITYTPDPGHCGTDTIFYTICDPEPLCDDAIVIVEIECPPDDLLIPEGFSPNGDGIGDAWVIQGLQLYPNNNVRIYNRWGDLVYNATPYNNDWDGNSTSSKSVSGVLPVGTYWYILDLGVAGEETRTGFVYLNK